MSQQNVPPTNPPNGSVSGAIPWSAFRATFFSGYGNSIRSAPSREPKTRKEIRWPIYISVSNRLLNESTVESLPRDDCYAVLIYTLQFEGAQLHRRPKRAQPRKSHRVNFKRSALTFRLYLSRDTHEIASPTGSIRLGKKLNEKKRKNLTRKRRKTGRRHLSHLMQLVKSWLHEGNYFSFPFLRNY